jgi:hypothetical protein
MIADELVASLCAISRSVFRYQPLIGFLPRSPNCGGILRFVIPLNSQNGKGLHPATVSSPFCSIVFRDRFQSWKQSILCQIRTKSRRIYR